MESIDLDMEDLFDNGAIVDGNDDEDLGTGQELQRMEDDENQENPATQNEGEDGDVLAKLRDLSKGASKRRVMKPQPKLDHIRLTGDRGIPTLPKMFENIKFKGRGHEGEDLARMMSMFEHWAHRLFPKMTFDEVIERCERLGAKKGVQTCVKRMRLDMPILDEDFVGNRDDENDEEGNEGLNNRLNDQSLDADAEEVLDELMEAESSSQRPSQTPQPHSSVDKDDFEAMMQEEAMRAQSQPVARHGGHDADPRSPERSNQTVAPSASNSLTEDQKERMERNKRIAMEKRKARLANAPAQKSANNQINDSQQQDNNAKDTTNNSPENNAKDTTNNSPENNATDATNNFPENNTTDMTNNSPENNTTDTTNNFPENNSATDMDTSSQKDETTSDACDSKKSIEINDRVDTTQDEPGKFSALSSTGQGQLKVVGDDKAEDDIKQTEDEILQSLQEDED